MLNGICYLGIICYLFNFGIWYLGINGIICYLGIIDSMVHGVDADYQILNYVLGY